MTTALLDAIIGLSAAFLALKSYAVLWSFYRVFVSGNGLARLLREHAPDPALKAELRKLRPIGTWLYDLPKPLGPALATLFRGPITISLGAAVSVVAVTVGESAPGLLLALGVATAICALLHLVSALIWRLAFGREAYRLYDVKIPPFRQIKEWAVIHEPGQNLIPYFLSLLYISVLGFMTLYIGVSAVDPAAYAVSGGRSAFTWFYFSITTMATLGDSEAAARGVGAQIAVVAQLATGPLLLSWLLAHAAPLSNNGSVQERSDPDDDAGHG